MDNKICNLYLIPQWVCCDCGHNMIGKTTDNCPFCGASHDKFTAWDVVEKNYRVTTLELNNGVSQLHSVPKMGLEHAAYRIETAAGNVWIDSPTVFNRNLEPVDAILFTHNHVLGASNQYRRFWQSKIWLHEMDARHPLAAEFIIDHPFNHDFSLYDVIDGFPIGGHTPGFTLYIYQDVLFISDYMFLNNSVLSFNRFGSQPETIAHAHKIHEIITSRHLKTVCGYNYVIHFAEWFEAFERLIFKQNPKSTTHG